MKQIFSKTMRLLLASALLFSMTNCTKEEAKEAEINSMDSMSKMKKKEKAKMYKAYLNPLNNSGVSGMATLKLEGDMLTVTIEASGLTPNRLHPQHIHGFKESNKNAKCPTMAADTNGNGLVELGEGLPFYGPVLLNLTPFPTANDMGMITYMNTFTVEKVVLPLQNNTIVLHGMMVNGEYWASLPVACGQIMPDNGNN